MKNIIEEIDEEAENYISNKSSNPLFRETHKRDFIAGAKVTYDKCVKLINDLVIENQGLKLYKDNEGTRAIEFAEWISKYGYDQDYDDKLWRYWDSGIGEYTTEELYKEFLKDKERLCK